LPVFLAKIVQSQNVTREKLRKGLFYAKGERKMLMKFTTGRRNSALQHHL